MLKSKMILALEDIYKLGTNYLSDYMIKSFIILGKMILVWYLN